MCNMKAIIVLACMVGLAICAPQPASYIEVEIKQTPGISGVAAPVSGSSLQAILKALSAAQGAGGPQVLVKQSIPQPAGRESVEIYYPLPAAPAAAPAAPAAPVAPVVPVAPAAPAAPAAPVSDDEEEDD